MSIATETKIGSNTNAALKISLGLGGLVLSGMLCMFPWATTQTFPAAQITSGGMAVLVYFIGLCAMIFTGLSYKFMSQEFPIAGSAYTYVQRAMHRYIGFIAGWVIIMDYTTVPGLLVKFSTIWLSGVTDVIPPWLIIVLFLVVCTAVAYFGNTVNFMVNSIFFWAQIAFLVAFAGFVFKFVIIDGKGMGHFSFLPIYNPDTFSWGSIASAASIGILGFIGADTIANMSEEARNATRSIGKAIIMCILMIGAIFMGTGYLAAIAHPDFSTLDPDMGMFDIMREVGGDTFYYFMVIGCVLFVGIANVIPPLVSVARVFFAMGRDGALPFSKFFSKVHPKYKTPSNSILFIAVVSLLVTELVDLGTLSSIVNIGAMTTYLLLNITVPYYFLFKKKVRGIAAYLKYGLCPLIGIAVILYIFTGFAALTFEVAGVWLALGIILLIVRRNHYKTTPLVIEE